MALTVNGVPELTDAGDDAVTLLTFTSEVASTFTETCWVGQQLLAGLVSVTPVVVIAMQLSMSIR